MVEFALVLPIFFLLVFGMIEYGRMVMVQQILTNASREGARRAVLDGVTETQVKTDTGAYLTGAGIGVDLDDPQNFDYTLNDPVGPDNARSVTITVGCPFAEVSWLPSPMYLGSYRLSASTTMRRETVE